MLGVDVEFEVGFLLRLVRAMGAVEGDGVLPVDGVHVVPHVGHVARHVVAVEALHSADPFDDHRLPVALAFDVPHPLCKDKREKRLLGSDQPGKEGEALRLTFILFSLSTTTVPKVSYEPMVGSHAVEK